MSPQLSSRGGLLCDCETSNFAKVCFQLESFHGDFIFQACMAGIVFAKFTKPTMRAETILFSKNALITVRNGSMYLVCRIADLR